MFHSASVFADDPWPDMAVVRCFFSNPTCDPIRRHHKIHIPAQNMRDFLVTFAGFRQM
jgi:hypothetical protein